MASVKQADDKHLHNQGHCYIDNTNIIRDNVK